jgi:tetratricopeptide (TPR) repeat protein
MKYQRSLFLMLLLVGGTIYAQWPGTRMPDRTAHNDVVRGQIYTDRGTNGTMTIELSGFDQVGGASTTAEGDGTFELDGVSPGSYRLRVINSAGQVLHEESVFITAGYQNLSIHISNRPNANQPSQGSVSLRQLQHKVAASAQKEYERGRLASTKGDQYKALEHLQKAATIDPQFADAHNGLGVVQMALGQTQLASEEFQRAISLEPDHDQAVANLGVALFKLQRFREAEEVARHSLKLNPSRSKIRYVLGTSIVSDGGDKTEALFHLERAAVDMPEAHLLVAKLLADSGRRDEAAKHLNEYLRAQPHSEFPREKVEAWLAQLRQ